LAHDDDDDNVGDYDDDNMTIDMMTLLTVNQSLCGHIIMTALHSRCRHYILQLWFLSFFRLFSAVRDWMSTILAHMMRHIIIRSVTNNLYYIMYKLEGRCH